MNLHQDLVVEPTAQYALLAFECQNHLHPKPIGKTLGDILDKAKKHAPPSQTTQAIQENVWLIPLHTDMPFLARLLGEASMASMPMQILFLHERPDWIKVPPDAPKTDAAPVS